MELCRLSSSQLSLSSRRSHLVEQLQQLEALAFEAPKLIRSVAEAPPCCPGETLAELEEELRERGIRLAFGNLRDRVKKDILRGLDLTTADDDLTFPSVAEAAQAVRPG